MTNLVNNINKMFIDKIFENLNKYSIEPGIIIASTSKKDPDYFYHWVRDSALIMKTICKYYKETKDDRCFRQIINYIDVESHHQNLNTLSGLGEPKFNVCKQNSLFNEIWGRPQNDGPALRGLTMLYIYDLFSDKKTYQIIIKNIIDKDLVYTINNLENESFDLWEEIKGFHFYTLSMIYKFLKNYNNKFLSNNFNIENILLKLKQKIKDNNLVYNSISNNKKINRNFDSSLFLCLNHIDYDNEIIDIFNENFKNYIRSMVSFYKNSYNINKNNKFIFIGRYENDTYFGGNPWIITTISLIQLLIYYSKNNINLINDQEKIILEFMNYIMKIKNLDISEQIDKNNGSQISASNLTWNYSELYNMWDLLL